MVTIGTYFNKRRGLATLLASVGGSIGSLSFPPLVQYCLDKFGLQGVLMILAGIVFNFTVVGALLRPTTFYDKMRSSKKQIQKEEKYHVKANGNVAVSERESSRLLETDKIKNGGTQIHLHRSQEQIQIEPIERFRTFSDTSGMKRKEKITALQMDKTSSIQSIKHLADSFSKKSFILIGSTLDMDGSLYNIAGSFSQTLEEQSHKNQNNTKASRESCFSIISKTTKSILLQIFSKDVLCNRLFANCDGSEHIRIVHSK